MRNGVERRGGSGRGTVAEQGSDLLANIFPCRTLERDGSPTGCWYVDGVRVQKGTDGRPAVIAHVVGSARGTDGRGIGIGFEAPLDGNLPFGVLRELARAAAEDGRGGPGTNGAFVSGLRAMGNFVEVFARTGAPPYLGAVGEAIGVVVASPPDEASLRAAARVRGADMVETMRRFLSTLDPEALAMIPRQVDAGTDAALGAAWPALDRTSGTGAPLAEAIRARPWQARALIDAWPNGPRRIKAAVTEGVIDTLVGDLLAETGLLPPGTGDALRTVEGMLGHVDVRDAVRTSPSRNRALALVRRSKRVPERDRPGGAGQWRAFSAVSPVFDMLSGWEGLTDPVGLLVASGRDWRARRVRLCGASATADLDQAVRRFDLMSDALAREVVMPAAALALGRAPDVRPSTWPAWRNAAHVLLFSGRTLLEMMRAGAAWEASPAVHDPAPSDARWVAYLPDVDQHLVHLRVVTDRGGLGKYSRCLPATGASAVPRLVRECLQGRMRALCLTRSTGSGEEEVLSLAILSISERPFRVLSHHGPDGSDPDQDAVNALDRYVRRLRNGTLSPVEPSLATVQHRVALEDLCGYDWHDREVWILRRRAWDPVLQPALRDAEPWQLARVAGRHLQPDARRWHGHVALPRRELDIGMRCETAEVTPSAMP